MEVQPFGQVLRTTNQAPGYPVLILGMSKIVRLFSQAQDCDIMAASAQIVTMLAGVLIVIPMYLTGKQLFDARIGFFAALMFQIFPVCMHVTSDGLSEGPFFLFAAWGLYFGSAAVMKPTWWRFLTCGELAGSAYFIRPEGLEIAAAVAIAAIFAGFLARSWLTPARALAGLLCGVIPFAGGYFAVTGTLTRKPTSMKLVQPEPETPAVAGPPLAAYWGDGIHPPNTNVIRTGLTVLGESTRTCQYFGLPLALFGLWVWRSRLQSQPALWAFIALGAIHILILWRMAVVVGYVSDRHTMMVAFVTAFGGASAICTFIGWAGGMPWLTPAICGLLMVGALPSELKPLHANRAGHHAAGCWLAEHVGESDEIVDPFAWARYYSGAAFREDQSVLLSPIPHAHYVVLENSANEHSRLGGIEEARKLAARGRLVFQWPEKESRGTPQVAVYRVEPGQ
jgi:hypothetical protein